MRRLTWTPLLLLVMVGAVLSACGGKSLSGSSAGTDASPPAAAVESTATATAGAAKLVPLLANVTPVLPAATPGANSVLGGSDRRTAAALTALLKGTSLDQPGVSLYVFPIAGAGGSLLVLEMDAAKGAAFSGDPLPRSSRRWSPQTPPKAPISSRSRSTTAPPTPKVPMSPR